MTPRIVVQLVVIVGAFLLAALGELDADAAIAFVSGALVIPSAGDALAAHRRRTADDPNRWTYP